MGELKGFALALQFNPENTSALSTVKLKELHALIGSAPALDNDAGYRADLEAARTLLKTEFGFEGDVTQW